MHQTHVFMRQDHILIFTFSPPPKPHFPLGHVCSVDDPAPGKNSSSEAGCAAEGAADVVDPDIDDVSFLDR